MKVLQFVKTSDGAIWAYNQTWELIRLGVDIITVLPKKDGHVAELYYETNLPVYIMDASLSIVSFVTFFRKIKGLRQLVRKIQPDLIHCHFVTNILMLRLSLIGICVPRFFQVPGPLHLESPLSKYADILTAGNYDYYGASCRKTEYIYNKSRRLRDRVFLTYYGGNFHSNIESDGRLHQEYCISNHAKIVGMVAYFYRPKRYLLKFRGIKGHEDFICAVAQLRKIDSSIIGFIIGGAWVGAEKYEERVRYFAQDACPNGIVFTGIRKDIANIYSELDVVVHPSLSENLGGAVESLAAGVPTVATNVGGFPDVIIHGETGLLVAPKNPTAITKSVLHILNDYDGAKKMAQKGKAYVSKFNVQATAAAVKQVYETIIKMRN